jgi:hypothetical protein
MDSTRQGAQEHWSTCELGARMAEHSDLSLLRQKALVGKTNSRQGADLIDTSKCPALALAGFRTLLKTHVVKIAEYSKHNCEIEPYILAPRACTYTTTSAWNNFSMNIIPEMPNSTSPQAAWIPAPGLSCRQKPAVASRGL